MSDIIPMTRAGYNKIKAEIDRMENEEMPIILKRLADARAEGDLKENAEYHGARESQGMLQAKISQLRGKLANSTIIDVVASDEVAFGAKVTVLDLEYDDEEEFTLVGAGEEDYDNGKILITSPFGQGLLGKKVGDKVEIEAPVGTLKFEVLKIEYDIEEE
ncbi:MAG: transcription elongation factor GreA [Planctomycetales bacterium]|nr:transcription elongation factor GreA [Planctomycetales bacterium]